MTREQQIEILNNMRNDVYENSEEDQALYYAIRAIETLTESETGLQPTCNQLATDCVSRQADIDAVERNAYRHTYIDQIVDIIKALPAAQPERKKGKWIHNPDPMAGEGYWRCSECGYDAYDCGKYCPNCGSYNGCEQE